MEFLEQEEPPRPEYEAKCIYERKNPITGVHHALSFFFHNQRNGLNFSSLVTTQNSDKEIRLVLLIFFVWNQLFRETFLKVLLFCDSGQREGSLYKVWTMCSGVVRNWDGVVLGNVKIFFSIFILLLYFVYFFFLFLKSYLIFLRIYQ